MGRSGLEGDETLFLIADPTHFRVAFCEFAPRVAEAMPPVKSLLRRNMVW
jgi:hypothetical protein